MIAEAEKMRQLSEANESSIWILLVKETGRPFKHISRF